MFSFGLGASSGVAMSQAEDSELANRVEKIRGHLRDDKSNSAQQSVGAAQPPSDLTLANITCDHVRDANIMVDYAIRRVGEGSNVPPDVLQDIAQAKKQLIEGQVSFEAGVRFVAASAKLARVISPATIKSINFSGVQIQLNRIRQGRWSGDIMHLELLSSSYCLHCSCIGPSYTDISKT